MIDLNIKKQIVQKIIYEKNMFDYVGNRIKKEWDNVDKETKNLLLEDYLLHARILRDFFTKKPKDDDVHASQFVDNQEAWQSVSNNLCCYLKENKVRIDKRLAHLTYARLSLEEKWNFDAIEKDILESWSKFLIALSNFKTFFS